MRLRVRNIHFGVQRGVQDLAVASARSRIIHRRLGACPLAISRNAAMTTCPLIPLNINDLLRRSGLLCLTAE